MYEQRESTSPTRDRGRKRGQNPTKGGMKRGNRPERFQAAGGEPRCETDRRGTGYAPQREQGPRQTDHSAEVPELRGSRASAARRGELRNQNHSQVTKHRQVMHLLVGAAGMRPREGRRTKSFSRAAACALPRTDPTESQTSANTRRTADPEASDKQSRNNAWRSRESSDRGRPATGRGARRNKGRLLRRGPGE